MKSKHLVKNIPHVLLLYHVGIMIEVFMSSSTSRINIWEPDMHQLNKCLKCTTPGKWNCV